jgi:hypothetical protein
LLKQSVFVQVHEEYSYSKVNFNRRSENVIQLKLKFTAREGINWIHLVHDKDYWRTIGNAVMNMRVPKMVGNLLSSWTTITCSFSARALFHGVRYMKCNMLGYSANYNRPTYQQHALSLQLPIKFWVNMWNKNTNHQQMHKESSIINCNTLLHVSTLLGHLRGELFVTVTLRLHFIAEWERAVSCVMCTRGVNSLRSRLAGPDRRVFTPPKTTQYTVNSTFSLKYKVQP